MQYDKQKSESQFLKVFIIFWIILTGLLYFHTWQSVQTKSFLATEPLVPWWIFALVSGMLVGSFAWDQFYVSYKVTSRRNQILYMTGFLAYFLIVLVFNMVVFAGMLFAIDGAMSRLYPNDGTVSVTIYPHVSPGANPYLLLLFYIAVTIAQALSIGKPMARWFNTTMESRLNLTNRPPTEPRYFRTKIRPGSRVEIASPELEAGQTVDVVVRPIKYREEREG